jgi:hypothetical protein
MKQKKCNVTAMVSSTTLYAYGQIEVYNIKEVFTMKVTAALGVHLPDEEFTVVAFKGKSCLSHGPSRGLSA